MHQDEKKLDFKPLGIAVKKVRETKGWTQEYLAQLVDLMPRSITGSVAKFPINSFRGKMIEEDNLEK